MGKKRKFNRFIRWIKSDLPEEKSSVLLLRVAKLPSPSPQRRVPSNPASPRPHTLHFDCPVSRSSTLDSKFNETCLENGNSYDDLHVPSVSAANGMVTPCGNLKLSSPLPKEKLVVSCSKSPYKHNPPSPELASTDSPDCGRHERKKVSFSKETEELITARDIARKNRDLVCNCNRDNVNNYVVENGSSNSLNGNKGERSPRKSLVEQTDVNAILNEISDELIGPKPRSVSLKSESSLEQYKLFKSRKDDCSKIKPRSKSLSLSTKITKPDYKRKRSFDQNSNVSFKNSLRISEEDLRSNTAINKLSGRRRTSDGSISVNNQEDLDTILDEITEELDIGPRAPSRSRSRSQSKSSNSNVSAVICCPVFSPPSSTLPPSQTPVGIAGSRTISSIPYENECNRLDLPPIKMDRSVDSIGSCSLDVEMSTDFSDSSVGSISDCTLRSVSILTPTANGVDSSAAKQPELQPRRSPLAAVDTTAVVGQKLAEPTIRITDADTATKKPSYLNLACCVNGYSNLTTYDSKLRETYRSGNQRSREVSPNRPFSANENYVSNLPKAEGSPFLTPDLALHNRKILVSPASSKMASNGSFSPKSPNFTNSSYTRVLQNGSTGTNSTNYFSSTPANSPTFMASKSSSYYSSAKSYLSSESRDFASSMLYSPPDQTDACGVRSPQHFATPRSAMQSTKRFESTESSSYLNGTSSHHSYSETSISYSTPSKSFIQQRVERLYGPGALAQGFFTSTKRQKNRISESENGEKTESSVNESSSNKSDETNVDSESSMKSSSSSPSLPVLRHLRPEFRAQLPIMSPKRLFNAESTIQKSTTIPIALKDNIKSSLSNGFSTSEKSCDMSEIKVKPTTKEPLMIVHPIKVEKQISVESLTEHLPAAPQVILPVKLIEEDATAMKNEVRIIESETVEKKDGHYFLKILKNETDRLSQLAEVVEKELEEKVDDLPDEALGFLRSASGKARLLVSQKMQQFEGLCHKNINQVAAEPFPTTHEDLQGFWDMVMLQVIQVNDLFKDIDKLRANNWIETKPEQKTVSDSAVPKRKLIKKPVTTTTTSASAEAQRKQREAQRKQMLEQRRKAMAALKQQQQQGQTGDEVSDSQHVEIFHVAKS